MLARPTDAPCARATLTLTIELPYLVDCRRNEGMRPSSKGPNGRNYSLCGTASGRHLKQFAAKQTGHTPAHCAASFVPNLQCACMGVLVRQLGAPCARTTLTLTSNCR